VSYGTAAKGGASPALVPQRGLPQSACVCACPLRQGLRDRAPCGAASQPSDEARSRSWCSSGLRRSAHAHALRGALPAVPRPRPAGSRCGTPSSRRRCWTPPKRRAWWRGVPRPRATLSTQLPARWGLGWLGASVVCGHATVGAHVGWSDESIPAVQSGQHKGARLGRKLSPQPRRAGPSSHMRHAPPLLALCSTPPTRWPTGRCC
jgi:hypothetical protein